MAFCRWTLSSQFVKPLSRHGQWTHAESAAISKATVMTVVAGLSKIEQQETLRKEDLSEEFNPIVNYLEADEAWVFHTTAKFSIFA